MLQKKGESSLKPYELGFKIKPNPSFSFTSVCIYKYMYIQHIFEHPPPIDSILQL